MGPIGPLGQNLTPGAAYIAQPRNEAAIATARPLAHSAAGLTQVDAAIGQMLTGIGGDLETGEALQLLIGLVILLALLRVLQDGNESPQSALSPLACGRHQLSWLGLLGSQTSFEFQQSTTTIAFGAAESYAAVAESGSSSSHHGGVEISA